MAQQFNHLTSFLGYISLCSDSSVSFFWNVLGCIQSLERTEHPFQLGDINTLFAVRELYLINSTFFGLAADRAAACTSDFSGLEKVKNCHDPEVYQDTD